MTHRLAVLCALALGGCLAAPGGEREILVDQSSLGAGAHCEEYCRSCVAAGLLTCGACGGCADYRDAGEVPLVVSCQSYCCFAEGSGEVPSATMCWDCPCPPPASSEGSGVGEEAR